MQASSIFSIPLQRQPAGAGEMTESARSLLQQWNQVQLPRTHSRQLTTFHNSRFRASNTLWFLPSTSTVHINSHRHIYKYVKLKINFFLILLRLFPAILPIGNQIPCFFLIILANNIPIPEIKFLRKRNYNSVSIEMLKSNLLWIEKT